MEDHRLVAELDEGLGEGESERAKTRSEAWRVKCTTVSSRDRRRWEGRDVPPTRMSALRGADEVDMVGCRGGSWFERKG